MTAHQGKVKREPVMKQCQECGDFGMCYPQAQKCDICGGELKQILYLTHRKVRRP